MKLRERFASITLFLVLPNASTFQSSPTCCSFRTRPLRAVEEDSFDVEDARSRLESLMITGGDEQASDTPIEAAVLTELHLNDLPPLPPLTSIERDRRLAEMDLLAELENGDAAIAALWSLWFQERGPDAAKKLAKAEALTSQGPVSWPEAESVLEELIEEYGVHFTEPVNRLATLYYLQDRLEESEKLCNIVLDYKPWHFGALSGIVMVHAGLRNVNAARLWASRRLPTFASQGPNNRRQGWVKRALRDAEESLEEAEKRVSAAFGEPDQHARDTSRKSVEDDDEAWQ